MSDLSETRSNFNAKRRLDRAVDQLLGICAGIVADGEINDKELAYLSTWLSENVEVCSQFPGEQIAGRIRHAMADGTFDLEEHADLIELLTNISGNCFSDTGAAAPASPALPSDMDALIHFQGKSFCFTGKFSFGKRSMCEDEVVQRGGVCLDGVTKSLDYLVIGSGVSPDWKHETYGRKIERVLEIRENDQKSPMIILEKDWVEALVC